MSLRLVRLVGLSSLLAAIVAIPSLARAQDGSVGPGDGGSRSWMCPGAITNATQRVVFHRMAPIDFGPGTGMRSIGSRSGLGLEYNLLFSGRYDTEMRGNIAVRWPVPLTLSAPPEPMGGYLEAWFGLRMTATLYAAGIAIPLPLGVVIDDNEGHGRSMFTPWAWNFEGTDIHLNVSAWRTIYRTTVNVLAHNIEFQLQMRYNTTFTIRTVEIGFPDRGSPTSMMLNLAVINGMTPEAVYPPPPNGMLELLTRWRSQIRYQGTLEFRIQPRCADSLDLICLAASGLLGAVLRPVETGAIAESRDILPDPFDQSPRYSLPVQRIDNLYIDFGDVRVGESAMLPIEVSNPGAALLDSEPTASTDTAFRVGAGVCIPAGGTSRIPVTFTPPRIGVFRTDIMVESNGITGTPMTVTLTGNGAMETRPATMRVDAGAGDGSRDGGRGRAGIDAGCECRAGSSRHTRGGAAAALAFLAALASVRSRRALESKIYRKTRSR